MLFRRAFGLLVIITISIASGHASICGECSEGKSSYCASNTTYGICERGEPWLGPFDCTEGMFCSDNPDGHKRCVSDPTATSVCGVDPSPNTKDNCGQCAGNDTFQCVDKSHYRLCASQIEFQCADDDICAYSLKAISKKPCEPEDFVKYFEGTCEVATTTTTAGPLTTPNIENLTKACKDDDPGERYFFTAYPDDKTCKKYLYCENSFGSWDYVTHWCPKHQYFNSAQKKCDSIKPSNCE